MAVETEAAVLPQNVVDFWLEQVAIAEEHLDIPVAPFNMIVFYSTEKEGVIAASFISSSSRLTNILYAPIRAGLVGFPVKFGSVKEVMNHVLNRAGKERVGFTYYARDHVTNRFEKLNWGTLTRPQVYP